MKGLVGALLLSIAVLSGCSVSSGLYKTDGKEYGVTLKTCVDSFDVTEALKDKKMCVRSNTAITVEPR